MSSKNVIRLLAALLVSASTVPAIAASEVLTLGGAGSGLGTMRALAKEFAKEAPDISINVLPSLGSNGGAKALTAGVVDLAVMSRPLTAQETGQGLVPLQYGKTPFVFVTSKEGAPGIKSLKEVTDVIAGRKTSWSDGSPIRVVMQNRTDGNSILMESLSTEMKEASELARGKRGAIINAYGESAAATIEKTPGSIGTSTLALVLTSERRLHMLAINGVAPMRGGLANAAYPYTKTMYLVRKANGRAAAQRFVDFVASPKGRQILLGTGHVMAESVAAR
jgi:phosphate transport system substrate-binding protein